MIDASINKNIDRIAMRLKTIPENPGVYQHLDEQGNVIYVGKARNLQRRVSSYFSHYDDKSAKIKMLVRHIYDIRVTVVATEVDALLLENNLIKRYQPRYNSMLKDDKSYPYLCITDEEYPRLLFTRNRQLKGQYFGPYPNQRIMRELQDIIDNLFSYRKCNKMQNRPCIKHQIGLCKAPCAGLQSHEDYIADINNIRNILKGNFSDIVEEMKRQMLSLADQLRFEEAEVMKRRIRRLEEYQSRSTVVNTNVKDVDVFGIVSDENDEILMIFRYGCWDFPKGKVEAGEDWPTAALREVEEETGLHDISLHEPLPNTYHTYTLHGAPILKITHWYEMHAPQQSLTPQTEEDISQAVWVPRTEVADHLKESYLSLKELWGELAVSS